MDRRHFHHDINPVQHGAGNPAAVMIHIFLGTFASSGRISVPAAFAGVHGTDHHEFRRIGHRGGGTGNGDLAVFQRLAHHVQGIFPEFRHFIQEQNTFMGHGNFTGAGIAAAACQACIGHRMMRRTEGPRGNQRFFRSQKTHHRINLASFA